MQKFYKGRTNNHLTWVMVDATDFATPESALSAATKIKIYGKLRGAAGVNFVSSGTGSLTNDITHVGASVLGIYSIGLAKADLSDASAAWYDQYIISLSATGAAYQTLIVDGGIDDSVMLLLSDAVSNVMSAVLLTQSLASDAASAAVQTNSRVLLLQSAVSDVDSALTSQFNAISSIESDIYSNLSDLKSDFQSRVPKAVATNSQLSDLASDIKSAVAGITATVGASDISDIASAVKAILASDLSDILSAAVQTNSRVLVVQSQASDIYSNLSDLKSDFQSRVPKAVATNSQLSDLHSDLLSYLTVMSGVQSDIRSLVVALSDAISNVDSAVNSQYSDLASKIGAVTVTISASDVSDIASAVVAGLPVTSAISDIYSLLSSLNSEFLSRVPKAVATASHLSDFQSDFQSRVTGAAATASQFADRIWSDFESKAGASPSQLYSVLVLAASRVSDVQSYLATMSSVQSDLYSLLSDTQSKVAGGTSTSAIAAKVWSDFTSKAGATPSQLYSVVLIGASAASDAASAAQQANSRVLLLQSAVSDVDSALTSQFNAISSINSDIYSNLSDFKSDFQSRVPKAVATNSQLSDLHSDLKSYLTVMSGIQSDITSTLAAGVPVSPGGIAATAFAAGAIDAAALAQDAAQEIADEVLNRNLAGGGSGNTRNVRNALRSLRNKQAIVNSVLTLYQEDDTTVAWSAAINTAAGNPLQEIDP